MMRLRMLTIALVAGPLAACTMNGMPGAEAPGQGAATAAIRNSAGIEMATATATQEGDSVRLRIETMRMPAGTYGAHIHTTGRCDAPAFTTAGPHWNPTNRQHGKDNPAGMHRGDLPNLLVGTDGRGALEFTLPNTWIAGGPMPMLDADGAAIVIHQRPDDYRTDPSGNSGDRIACGVFG